MNQLETERFQKERERKNVLHLAVLYYITSKFVLNIIVSCIKVKKFFRAERNNLI